jgi:trk system potassium uptake protein
MTNRRMFLFTPGRIILFSILCAIAIGTALLSLPIAHKGTVSFLDLFFTATSATCVTGLFTIPLDQLTTFGHVVLLVLIQIGGLGLITLTLFLMYLFVNLGFAAQLLAGQILDIDAWHHVKRILLFIVLLTLGIECVGALAILPSLAAQYTLKKAVFFSIFHAISSFCNAGISLFPHESLPGLYVHNNLLLGITTALTFFGGLGFITWIELFYYLGSLRKKKRYTFSLLSKIILSGSLILIVIPTLLIWILEYHNTFAHMTVVQSWYNALCNAITIRSAGFLTVPVEFLHIPTLLVMLAASFIGTSPGSTGSGVRISTFAIFLATIKVALSGQTHTNIKERRIPKDQVYKSIAIISISFFWILITIFLLSITEEAIDFVDIIVEAISAFTNLGISTGITPLLSIAGKLFIIASMIIGRIGGITLILALRTKRMPLQLEAAQISYPEERVMLS